MMSQAESPSGAHQTSTASVASGPARLVICVSFIAVVWLAVLPWWANQPTMQQHLHELDEQGIDPSAMYYTELEAMEPILRRLERR